METLILVPLEDTVVFPHMTLTLAVDVGDADRVLLVPRHENDFASVGTVAEVADRSLDHGVVRPPKRHAPDRIGNLTAALGE